MPLTAPPNPRDAHPSLEDLPFDEAILTLFHSEATSGFDKIETALATWGEHPGEDAAARTIYHLVHSTKGAAYSVGRHRLGEVLHALEELLDLHLHRGGLPDVAAAIRTIGASLESARWLLEEPFRAGRPEPVVGSGALPLNLLFGRLRRVALDAGRRAAKPVVLEVTGGEIRVGATIQSDAFTPCLHFVRNAVAHGIEDAATRRAAGKPCAGTIRLSARLDGDRVEIEVADDGRGLDLERIRDRAERAGILPGGGATTGEQLAEAIFAPGLSTSPRASRLSGRGMGMDAARRSVEQLGGQIKVSSRRGRGCSVRLRIPRAAAARAGRTAA